MVFGLFKSGEDKLKEHISKTYDNYLNILKTVPDDEIGFVLDYAVKIKCHQPFNHQIIEEN